MGRTYVRLDPPGYKYVSEPGFDLILTGAELVAQLQSGPSSLQQLFGSTNLFNPPGSEWLLPRPRQFDPTWHTNLALEDYVIRLSRWSLLGGVVGFEYEFTAIPGGATNDANQWLNLAVPETGLGAPLDAVDYPAAFAAADIAMPAGWQTVAIAGTTPLNHDLSAGQFHSSFQWASWPAPDDLITFGFSNLLFILNGIHIVILRKAWTLNEALEPVQGWELLGRFSRDGRKTEFRRPGTTAFNTNMFDSTPFETGVGGLTVIPVGTAHIYLFFASGEPAAVQLRPPLAMGVAEPLVDLLIPGGPWYIGGRPGQRIVCQTQVVGYEPNATTPDTGTQFDLGGDYIPTVEPQLAAQLVLYQDPAGDGITTGGDDQISVSSAFTSQSVTYGIRQPDNSLWSTGIDNKGHFYLGMASGNQGAQGYYLAPAVRLIELKWPVVLTDRLYSDVLLDDTQFKGWKYSTSLRDPEGKRVEVELLDSGLYLLMDALLHGRDQFPIHIEEDTDGNGIPDTVRAVGWIVDPELEEIKTEASDGNPAIISYKLTGRGLLERANQPWRYLPQLANPAGAGHLESATAILETLRRYGFDTDDATVWLPFTDPHAGTEISRLPSTWGSAPTGIGAKLDSPWAPKWEETGLQYAVEVATQWRGWVLYEQADGGVRFHPDITFAVMLGYAYYVSAVLYRTKAAAVLAGATSRQIMLASPRRRILSPEGNVVRITGQSEGGGVMAHVICREPKALTEIGRDDLFTGEPRTFTRVPRFAVNESAADHIAVVMLLRRKNRKFMQTTETMLAPWRWLPTSIDVGHVVTLAGTERGDHVIVDMEVECLKSAASPANEVIYTRITGEKLPPYVHSPLADPAATGPGAVVAGAYPGAG